MGDPSQPSVRAPPPRHATSAGDRGVTARERAYRPSYGSNGLLQSRYVKLIILALALAVVLLGFAISVLFHSHPAFVQVQAETEVFRLDTSAGDPIAWPISGFKALRFDERGRARQADLREASTLELPRGTRVEVTRAGERGPLRINLTRVGDARPDGAASGATECPVAHLRKADGSMLQPLRGHAFLQTPEPPPQSRGESGVQPEREALILPLRGRPVIGDDVATGVRHVLLTGHVRILEPRSFHRLLPGFSVPTSFQTAEQELASGDRVVPRAVRRNDSGARTSAGSCDAGDTAKDDESALAILSGFARIADGKPMTVILQGPAEGVEVIRFGGAPLVVRSSTWARASSDPLYLVLAAASIVFLQLADWLWKFKELSIT